ncbi:hypothetical protein [Methanoculleus caldifontis]|uniref:hypothetical protein n=1 Tax=Methanoculleus caldifontis TaxID=2651577 RepID=UPI00293711D3|nr:hypothetical protein [Methanoculleus sp. Wushi-C6]
MRGSRSTLIRGAKFGLNLDPATASAPLVTSIASHATMGPLFAYLAGENERKLQAAAKGFLVALRRGIRSKPGSFDVMAFPIGRAPCDELGERSPADHAY